MFAAVGSPIFQKVYAVRYAEILILGTEIPVGLVKGEMRIPEAPVSCVFVGPGTGVAPMRAMIEERIHVGAKGISLWLFNVYNQTIS